MQWKSYNSERITQQYNSLISEYKERYPEDTEMEDFDVWVEYKREQGED